jgi:citrate synthase
MRDIIHTRIWDETPDPQSPFLGRAVRLYGYDYYGELMGRAGWIEVLWLLFTGDAPSPHQATLLERLAVALANPGPRDPAVHAAMCGGIGGSLPAASLMAALAVGSGADGGGDDLKRAMHAWTAAGGDFGRLVAEFAKHADDHGTWPGFNPRSIGTGEPVLQCLDRLAASPLAHRLKHLKASVAPLSEAARCGLSLTGLAAAAFADAGLSPLQGEALYLLFRLPGALAHALEQMEHKHKQFPFFTLTNPVNAEGQP